LDQDYKDKSQGILGRRRIRLFLVEKPYYIGPLKRGGKDWRDRWAASVMILLITANKVSNFENQKTATPQKRPATKHEAMQRCIDTGRKMKG